MTGKTSLGWSPERRWLISCAVAWVALLPAAAWLTMQDTFVWKVLGTPASALLGATSTVLIGALLIQRAQRRIEEHRRKQWLRNNFKYAVLGQDAIRAITADMAVLLYARISNASLESERRIPEKFLRADIVRLPFLPDDAKAGEDVLASSLATLDHSMRMTLSGPLATAGGQLRDVRRNVTAAYDDPQAKGAELGERLLTCMDEETTRRMGGMATEILQISHTIIGAPESLNNATALMWDLPGSPLAAGASLPPSSVPERGP